METFRRKRHAPDAPTLRHFGQNEFVKHKRAQALFRDPSKKWTRLQWYAFREELADKWKHVLTPAQRANWDRNALLARRAKLGQPAAALAEPSDVVVPPLWGLMSSDLPLSRKKLLQHMTHLSRQASSVRRECGQARPGLRTLAEASTQMAEEELGFHAPSRFTVMPSDKPVAFDVDEAAEKRRRSLSCRALHKGLCITAHAEILVRAKRLMKSLYRAASQDVVGRSLYSIDGVMGPTHASRHKLVAWSAFQRGKPQSLRFIATNASQVHDNFLSIAQSCYRRSTGLDGKLLAR